MYSELQNILTHFLSWTKSDRHLYLGYYGYSPEEEDLTRAHDDTVSHLPEFYAKAFPATDKNLVCRRECCLCGQDLDQLRREFDDKLFDQELGHVLICPRCSGNSLHFYRGEGWCLNCGYRHKEEECDE